MDEEIALVSGAEKADKYGFTYDKILDEIKRLRDKSIDSEMRKNNIYPSEYKDLKNDIINHRIFLIEISELEEWLKKARKTEEIKRESLNNSRWTQEKALDLDKWQKIMRREERKLNRLEEKNKVKEQIPQLAEFVDEFFDKQDKTEAAIKSRKEEIQNDINARKAIKVEWIKKNVLGGKEKYATNALFKELLMQ